ncbi:MAG: hypothetical protein ISR55_10535 [Bacteroidetes bacterium]|nr:hypothetical protein [Bacteroidota bacterium]MBL6964251.1 hypothetical protein [Bacteroidota bacterium]
MKGKRGFQPGQSGNPEGRPAGSRNKATDEIRHRITLLIERNLDNLEEDFRSLEPKVRLMTLERYLRYTVPPLSVVDIRAQFRPQLEALDDDQLLELAEKMLSLSSPNDETKG